MTDEPINLKETPRATLNSVVNEVHDIKEVLIVYQTDRGMIVKHSKVTGGFLSTATLTLLNLVLSRISTSEI